ncbi:MAG: mechanosensitive ion channel family protein [Bacteroidota bacterium]
MKRFYLVCILFCVSTAALNAQDQIPLDLSSPRAAVHFHLYYLQPDTYDPAKAAEALRGDFQSQEELEELAIELKQIYDGTAYYVEPEEIPADSNYRDTLKGQAIYRVYPSEYPDLYVKKYGNQWKYSRKSVGSIAKIHNNVFPMGSELFMEFLPRIGQQKFLGLYLWQYLGLGILLIVAFIGYKILDVIFNLMLRRILPRLFPKATFARELIAPVANPLSLLLVVVLVEWFLPSLLLPPGGIGYYLQVILQVMVPVFSIIVLYRLVDVIAEALTGLAAKTETTMDDQLVPLLTKITKLVVVGLGIIFVLDNLNVNVTALLAGVSIGGLALALAAQDTVKNFIGSVSIFVDRPFVIGDFIDTGSFSGVVTEVGVRSTRLRASDGAMVSIPNGKLADTNLTNHGVRTYRRYSTTLGLTYDTPPDKVEAFVNAARDIINAHPLTRTESTLVQFHEMADSSLNIFVAVIAETTEYGAWLASRQDIFLAIMRKAEELGVSFAFPSTSVYVEQMPQGD